MLVLSRKVGERISIGDQIHITIVRIQGQSVRLGVEAPADVSIVREEVADRPRPDATSDNSPAAVR